MELFLTSSVHAVARDIAQKVDLSKGSKLVFIDTAAEVKEGDLEWQKNDRQALVDAGFAVSDYTITGKTKSELEADLDNFDYLYLSGGNTAYLLEQSQKSGFIEVVRELVRNKGKIYIGTSGGSIIAGPKLPDYFLDDEERDLMSEECYGFVNFTLLPHWGREDFRKKYLEERLGIVFRDDQVPLLLLTDKQYVHVRDGGMEIVEVKNNL